MIPIPDLRYQAARDHLLRAMAILLTQGSAVIRLLVDEACRRCEAHGDGQARHVQPQNPPDSSDRDTDRS